MSFFVVTDTFPDMTWNGASHIHRSTYVECLLSEETMEFVTSNPMDKVLKFLSENNFHQLVEKKIRSYPLGDVEWLVQGTELYGLIYHLVARSLQNNKPEMALNRIQNPGTGNVFMPILIKGKVVCGIRIWAGHSEGGTAWRLGFRLRFEAVSEEVEVHERQRVKDILQTIESMETATEGVSSRIKELVEIMEPDAEVSTVRARIAMGYGDE